MRFFEGALHRGQGAGGHDKRRIGAGVTDMRAHEDFDLFRRYPLASDLGSCLLAERRPNSRNCLERLGAEVELDGLFACGANIGKPHAVSGQE